MADSKVALTAFLTRFSVHAELQAKITGKVEDGGLGCESVADFAGYFTSRDYESGCQTDILDGTKFSKDRIALSRLRIAWSKSGETVSSAASPSTGSSADLEAPLEEGARESQENDFKAAYGLVLEPEDTPSDALFNRSFREFRRKHKTIEDLSRVRSIAEVGPNTAPDRTERMGNLEIIVHRGRQSQREFRTVQQLMQAHLIMANSWMLNGTAMRPSKLVPGTMVRDFSLQDRDSLSSFMRTKSREHLGTEAQKIHFLLQRDQQTRLKARHLYNSEGWPWGEALKKVREQDLAVLWTVGQSAVLPTMTAEAGDQPLLSPVKSPGAPPRLTPRSDVVASDSLTSDDCCPDWNKNQCSAKQKLCPHQLKHVCNFMVDGPNGKQICGKWQHTAASHAQMAKRPGGQAGGKAGGKAKRPRKESFR